MHPGREHPSSPGYAQPPVCQAARGLRCSGYATRDSHTQSEDWNGLGLRRTNPDHTDGGAKPAWDPYASRSLSAPTLPLPTVRYAARLTPSG